MKLDLEQIKSITQGIRDVSFENERYRFFRFTEKEADVIGNNNICNTAGIQMLFKTDGNCLRLRVNVQDKTLIRSYFCFDIFENGELIGTIKNIEDSKQVGNYAVKKYPLGSFSGEFKLGNGKKIIRIVFPNSVIAELEAIEIDDATFIEPIKKDKILVAYGDSITQGYDSLHPSNTYAFRLAEGLGAELFNKGIGGAIFTPKLAAIQDGLNPDFVTVAYGTNDWGCMDRDTFRENADLFIDALLNKYPKAKVYVLSPIWRKDYLAEKSFGEFFSIEKILSEICEKYSRVKFISGFSLVPHEENCFGDLSLHPNDTGFKYYFNNLIKEI